MKGLPKNVKVGGFTYTVNPNDDFTQGAEVYAAVSDPRLEVRIGVEHSTSPLRVRAALLHELVHAVVSVYGGGEELGEPLVAALSSGLFQVLRDNPRVTGFILEAGILPGQVSVGGLKYTVSPDQEFTQGAGVYVAVNQGSVDIRISTREPIAAERVRWALLHGLVQAVADVYGPRLPLEERWELALASGLFQVLVDNPVATAFILAAEPAQTPENKENDSKPVGDGNEQRAQGRFEAHESSGVTLWSGHSDS